MNARLRMWLFKTMHQWHWVSAALCLAALLLFSITGVTLNHAGAISATPRILSAQETLPAALLAAMAGTAETSATLPAPVSEWLEERFDIDVADRAVEWSAEEAYVSAPGPGRDTWLAIDRASGVVETESTFRGWIAYLNDLHKGRNTGVVWQIFIDLVAVACLVFAISGLFLLYLQSRQRRRTWPVVGTGVGALVILMVFFAH